MSSTTGGHGALSDDDDFVPPPPWKIASNLILSLLGILALVLVLGAVLRDPIEYYSKLAMGHFGLGGIFAGVVLLDSTPFLTHEPIMLMAVGARYPLLPLAAVIAGGSMIAACINWVGGRFLGNRIPILQRMLKRYKIRSFIQKYGALAVGGGALLPMPYAIIGWGAGAAGAPFWTVVVGGVVRAVKVVVILSFLHRAWTLGG